MLRLRFDISPSSSTSSGARTEARNRVVRRSSTTPEGFLRVVGGRWGAVCVMQTAFGPLTNAFLDGGFPSQ